MTQTEQLLARLDELAAVEERATKRRRARASWPEMVGSTRNASLIALVRALVEQRKALEERVSEAVSQRPPSRAVTTRLCETEAAVNTAIAEFLDLERG